MRYWFSLGFLAAVLALAGLAGAQSAPFRVKPSDVDSEVKDPGKQIKETRTSVTTTRPTTSSAAKNLQSIEHETAKAAGPAPSKKAPSFKPEKEAANPKINIKGSGESKSGPPRVATDSYKGRLKQKGSHGTNY